MVRVPVHVNRLVLGPRSQEPGLIDQSRQLIGIDMRQNKNVNGVVIHEC